MAVEARDIESESKLESGFGTLAVATLWETNHASQKWRIKYP